MYNYSLPLDFFIYFLLRSLSHSLAIHQLIYMSILFYHFVSMSTIPHRSICQQVDWSRARDLIAPEDLYTPHTCVLETFYKLVNTYEKVHMPWLRHKAMAWIYEVIEKEDQFTNYIDIGKRLSCMCVCLYIYICIYIYM